MCRCESRVQRVYRLVYESTKGRSLVWPVLAAVAWEVFAIAALLRAVGVF